MAGKGNRLFVWLAPRWYLLTHISTATTAFPKAEAYISLFLRFIVVFQGDNKYVIAGEGPAAPAVGWRSDGLTIGCDNRLRWLSGNRG
jgi:hypothetical protein